MEKSIEIVKQEYTASLMSIKGVVGVGIGLSGQDKVINVMVVEISKKIIKKIPPELEGYATNILAVGEIKAF
jgi:hypothetical protein